MKREENKAPNTFMTFSLDFCVKGTATMYRPYIKHHGIKGQKWGVRNGPPYPLSESDKSKKEIQWSDSKKSSLLGKKMSREILNKVGGYTLADSAIEYLINRGLERCSQGDRISSLDNLRRISQKPTIDSAVKKANPGYPQNGYVLNCSHCVIAYELRRRGYDVEATKRMEPASENKNEDSVFGKNTLTTQKNKKGKYESEKEYDNRILKELTAKLSSFGEGSRGCIAAYGRYGGVGHIFSWEIQNGKLRFIDPQAGLTDASSHLTTIFAGSPVYRYARLDDRPVQIKNLHKFIRNK